MGATALDVLNQDPLTRALQNVAQYQPVPQPTYPAAPPNYDLNNIGHYFQYQPLQVPGQAQPAQQPQQYDTLQQLLASGQPGQSNKVMYRGKSYSANNPVLMQFPSSPHFRPSNDILQKAQEWEN